MLPRLTMPEKRRNFLINKSFPFQKNVEIVSQRCILERVKISNRFLWQLSLKLLVKMCVFLPQNCEASMETHREKMHKKFQKAQTIPLV